MRSFVRSVAAVSTLLLVGWACAAPTPVAVVPPLEAGLNSRWVAVDPADNPNSLVDALAVLSGGVAALNEVEQVVLVVDHGDDLSLASNLDPLSALGSDSFAVRFSGFLFIEARGTYQFGAFHDDGIRVILGGETVIEFAFDTGPTLTTSSVFDLEAGYYALDIVGWEQGGNYVNRFGFVNPNGALDVTADLWRPEGRVGLPEPGVLALAGVALLGLSRLRRR